MNRDEILDMIAAGQYADVYAATEKALCSERTTERATAYYLRGRAAWKEGYHADAITCYESAVALDPHSDAAVALEQAREIMSFYNKDLYNP